MDPRYEEQILKLCELFSNRTGYSVEPSTYISDLGITSLEMLQIVMSMGDARLLDVFPEFFDRSATPAGVLDAAYGA